MEALIFLVCLSSLLAFFSLVFSTAGLAMRLASPVLGGAMFIYAIVHGVTSVL